MEPDMIQMPDVLRSGDIINCRYGGTMLTGRVTFGPKDISVVTLEPVEGLVQSLHMMFMCPMKYSEGGVATPFCRRQAVRMLTALQKAYAVLKEHAPEVMDLLPEYDRIYDALEQDILSLEEEKKALRRKMKSGDITTQEYQSLLMPLREKLQDTTFRKDALFEDMFHLGRLCSHNISCIKETVGRMIGTIIR